LLAGALPVSGEVQGPATVNNTGAVTSPGSGPSGPAGQVGQVADASGMDAAAAMDAFASEIAPRIEALLQHLLRPSAGSKVTSSSSSHVAIAMQVSELARRHPEIGSGGDPDVVDAGLATLAASRRLAVVLKSLLATVEDTGRVGFDNGWQEARLLLKRA